MEREEAQQSIGSLVRHTHQFGTPQIGKLVEVRRKTGIIEHRGKSWEVPLADLKVWKTGNHALNAGQKAEAGEPGPVAAPASPPEPAAVDEAQLLVAFDTKRKTAYADNWRGFVSEPNRWKVYDSITGARRACGHLVKSNPDAVVLTLAEARAIWRGEDAASEATPASRPTEADPGPAEVPARSLLSIPDTITSDWVSASLELAAAADELVKAEHALVEANGAVASARGRFMKAQEGLRNAGG